MQRYNFVPAMISYMYTTVTFENRSPRFNLYVSDADMSFVMFLAEAISFPFKFRKSVKKYTSLDSPICRENGKDYQRVFNTDSSTLCPHL